MGKSNENKINFVKIITEMSSIIFAVLLALWLESWMEDNELKEQADSALLQIQKEIEQNNEELIEAIDLNNKSIDGIKKLLKEDKVTISSMEPFLMISGGSTSNSAWESAKMSPAMRVMPIEALSELTSIYDTQSYYISYVNFFFQQYIDLSANVMFDNNAKQSAQKFAQHLAVINELAFQLVTSYDIYLEKHKMNPKL